MNPYNLLDEPWIKVVTTTGDDEEVSLLDVFRRGNGIQSIRGEIATQDVAILRLLLAITHRALDGPCTVDDWKDAWQNQEECTERIVAYLEKFRDRFDLRHPDHPFFQVAGIHSPSGKVSGLTSLMIDVPNGSPFFAMRHGEGTERIGWAEAARWLVHVHAFDPAGIRPGAVGDTRLTKGKVYGIGPGWAGQLGLVIVEDQTLLRTILRNTVPSEVGETRLHIDNATDLPPWEQEPDPVGANNQRRMTGPVSCYTWQTRRVLLHGDDDYVTSLFLGNGDRATAQNRFTVEPLCAWSYSESKSRESGYPTYNPRRHRVERAFWRNLNSIVAGMDEARLVRTKRGDKIQRFLRPAVIEWQSILSQDEVIARQGLLSINAVGLEYGDNQAVVTELIDTHLDMPSALLNSRESELTTLVKDALQQTDEVAKIMRELARNLVVASGGSGSDKGNAGDDAARLYYEHAGRAFIRWLPSLAAQGKSWSECREEWRQTLLGIAWEQGNARADAVPSTAIAGRRVGPHTYMNLGLAMRFFNAALQRVLPSTAPTNSDQTPSPQEER